MIQSFSTKGTEIVKDTFSIYCGKTPLDLCNILTSHGIFLDRESQLYQHRINLRDSCCSAQSYE